MQRLAISLLGAPQISRDGVPVSFDTRKAVALLAYLACTRRGHSREVLAALLWPEYADARNALRRTLSSIQHALGTGWLDISREQVTLSARPDLWVDVAHFEAQLASAADHETLAAAVALYHADLLAGFTLRDSPAFDEWQFFEAERLQQHFASALERLAALHTEAGAHEAAIDAARRRLTLDPLHEPAHQTLMRLYAVAGQRSAALRQFRECARVLEQELGIAPGDETTQLYEAIRAAPAKPAARLHQSPPVRLKHEPLVGRDAECARLRAVYTLAQQGAVAIIEGPPGIGKTRLAEEVIATARAAGALVFEARCYADEAGLAYTPIAALLREATVALERTGQLAALPPDQLAEVARLVPALNRRAGLPATLPLAALTRDDAFSRPWLTCCLPPALAQRPACC